MRFRNSLLLLALLLIPTRLVATQAMMVTDIGSSAETIALGHIEGFNRSSAAIFENPAAFENMGRASLSVFTVSLMEEVTFRNMSFAYKTKWGVFAYGQSLASVDGIPTTTQDSLGHYVATGHFSYENTVDKLGYQCNPMRNLSLGANLVFLRSQAGTYLTGSGSNADLGAIYTRNKWDLSVLARNVLPGATVQYSNGQNETFRREFVLSAQMRQSKNLNLYGQTRFYSDFTTPLFAVAASYRLPLIRSLTFRTGYQQYQVDKEVRSNYALGLGIDFRSMQFNYTYEVAEHFLFKSNHYFSLNFNI